MPWRSTPKIVHAFGPFWSSAVRYCRRGDRMGVDIGAMDNPGVGAAVGARFRPNGPVDEAVLVVTFQSASDIDPLIDSLRTESDAQKVRLIIVDNASTDDTTSRARRHSDVVVIDAGANIGYAGGINLAMSAVGEAERVLVLNPDLRVLPGCLQGLRTRMLSTGAGIVVPAIEDSNGRSTLSLRHEPTVPNRLGDALFGSRWSSRPSWLSETVRHPSRYRTAHRIEWATGAALLIDRRASELIGPWDEDFFLYSEETDFFKRARDLGIACWYEPSARVVHREGGSGRSPQLVALTVVNAIRYVEKHHPRTAWLHRLFLSLHEVRRWADPTHRIARTILLDRRNWDELPKVEADMRRDGIDHVIVTRFNLPSEGAERLIRAQDGWLRDRVELFEKYTVPSVREQTTKNLQWIIYFDPESPVWLLDRLQPLVDEHLFTPLYREAVDWQDLAADAKAISGGRAAMLVTTNLDNDDALAVNFVERIQAAVQPGRREALFVSYGLIRSGTRTYLREDRHNAFCSVAEPWDGAQTAWRDWHIMLDKHMPSRSLDGAPGWLQVVHARNVSNRIRGKLVSPTRYAGLFSGRLADLPPVSPGELLADRLVSGPVRETRELVRIIGKSILLGVMGKDGLSRLREWIRDFRTR